jgi:hypothetical protein
MRFISLGTVFLASALALGACGGADTPADTTAAAHAHPGHGGPEQSPADAARADHAGKKTSHEHGSQAHEHDFPGAVNEFHEILSPIWHSEATPKPACAGAGDLYMAAENIDPMSAPEGVDAGAWQEAVDELLTSALHLSQACTQMGDAAAAQNILVELHDRFHALAALLGHEESGAR